MTNLSTRHENCPALCRTDQRQKKRRVEYLDVLKGPRDLIDEVDAEEV
jgi:hypothetical protein